MNKNSHPIQLHFDVEQNNLTAIDLLVANTDFSKQHIKQIMQKGCIWLSRNNHTQRLRRAKKQLQPGDTLHCYYDEKVLNEEITAPTLIKDEGDYSIWLKPYGVRSQGSKWGDHTTIYRFAEQHLQPQRAAFIVHRLDRAASGLIILAHKKNTARQFSHLFKQHKIKKKYRVIVHGQFPDSTQHFTNPLEGKEASSHATLIRYSAKTDRSLLDVEIDTGRKHQIRRHLSEHGYPLVGDRLYGNDEYLDKNNENLQLTAYYLAFKSPIDNNQKKYQLKDSLLPEL